MKVKFRFVSLNHIPSPDEIAPDEVVYVKDRGVTIMKDGKEIVELVSEVDMNPEVPPHVERVCEYCGARNYEYHTHCKFCGAPL